MGLDEAFEVSLVGHLSEVNSADVFQNRFYVFHHSCHKILFLEESQKEIYFASFGQFS